MTISPLQSSHTLIKAFGRCGAQVTEASSHASKSRPVYQSPVQDPVMVFPNIDTLFSSVMLQPVIKALKLDKKLQDNDFQSAVFPQNNAIANKSLHHLQSAFELDMAKKLITVEHSNGFYAAGMICAPAQNTLETSGIIISEFYLADTANIQTFRFCKNNQAAMPIMNSILSLIKETNQKIGALENINPDTEKDIWDSATIQFTGNVVDIIETHNILEIQQDNRHEIN